MSWAIASSHQVELSVLVAHKSDDCKGKVRFAVERFQYSMTLPNKRKGDPLRQDTFSISATCSVCGPIDMATCEVSE